MRVGASSTGRRRSYAGDDEWEEPIPTPSAAGGEPEVGEGRQGAKGAGGAEARAGPGPGSSSDAVSVPHSESGRTEAGPQVPARGEGQGSAAGPPRLSTEAAAVLREAHREDWKRQQRAVPVPTPGYPSRVVPLMPRAPRGCGAAGSHCGGSEAGWTPEEPSGCEGPRPLLRLRWCGPHGKGLPQPSSDSGGAAVFVV